MSNANSIKNCCRDILQKIPYPSLIVNILMFTTLGILGETSGAVLDRLFSYQGGEPYPFENLIDIYTFVRWLMPHYFLSIWIGNYTENRMVDYRFQAPRYGSMFRWWALSTRNLVSIIITYYVSIYAIVAIISYLLGDRLPGITVLDINRNSHFFELSNDTVVMFYSMLFRTILPMVWILLTQYSIYFLTHNTRLSGAFFITALVVCPFYPFRTAVSYIPVNWMMIKRSQMMLTDIGPSDGTIWAGSVLMIVGLFAFMKVSLRFKKIVW